MITTVETGFGTCGLLAITDSPTVTTPALPSIELAAAHAALHPDERAVADQLGPVRRRDFIAGRAALRALFTSAAGVPPAASLATDDRGAPIVPRGWVASISHKRGVAAVVLAPDRGWTVGIDVELAVPPRLDLGSRILTDGEQLAASALPATERGRRVTLAFAIKEAVYKAIDPFVRRYVGFREVELAIADDGAVAVRPVDAGAIPLEIHAEWREHAGLWLCVARARAA